MIVQANKFSLLSVSIAAAFLASCGVEAKPADPQPFAVDVANLFEEVCFRNIENLEVVEAIATEKQWVTINPGELPETMDTVTVAGRGGQKPKWSSSKRTAAWKTTLEGQELFIAIKEPERYENPSCEMIVLGKKEDITSIESNIFQAIENFGDGKTATKVPFNPPVKYPGRKTARFDLQHPRTAIFYSSTPEDERITHRIVQFGKPNL